MTDKINDIKNNSTCNWCARDNRMVESSGSNSKPRQHQSGCSLQKTFAFVVLLSVSVPLYFMLLTSNATTTSLLYGQSDIRKQYLDDFKWKKTPSSSTSQLQRKQPNYHVIFSTGCSNQMHWESYTFFYHAMKVKQPGNVTWIASGCKPGEMATLRQFYSESIRPMSPNKFHIHFTPDYSRWPGQKTEYKYNNKPNGVYHWMVHTLHLNETNYMDKYQDDIIILMDPDMILLRPLLHDFSNQPTIYAAPNPATDVVKHGYPMAQHDGYLSDEWQKFNISYISQGGTFPPFTKDDGRYYWNSGPPYLATVRDMYNMVNLWKEYVPKVYEEYPKLYAEMFGLITAKTQLNLPHTLVKSIVVSNLESRTREGWEYVDQLPEDQACIIPTKATSTTSPSKYDLPIVLHYCQRTMIGKFFFSKYRLKKKYISCDAPLLTHPPDDIAKLRTAVRPPPDRGAAHEMEVYNLTAFKAKREAFMLCGMISAVNEASKYYKTHNCAGKGNFSEVYNFHDDPHSL